jgi:uroporphyrinogen III methyltransferase / synthase
LSTEVDRMPRGLVSFVGAGPGDPALRTERAARRIAEADVVIEAGTHADVEALVALAREGKRVARVVAGDPLESPAIVAQARAVVAAGVAIEVVPGIGAQSAVAAFAGVLGPAARVAVDDVSRAVASEPAGAVVTLVAAAGSPAQRVVTVSVTAAEARARELGSIDVIVATGAPDETLRWAERRPLFGKRVLVTRAREQAGSTAALLRDLGAEPVVVPTIEIHPPSDPAPLAAAIASLQRGASVGVSADAHASPYASPYASAHASPYAGPYHWVAFTSANGVDFTWAALTAAGGDARAFGGVRLAAIGPATARALERRGLRADVVATEFRGEALAEAMLSSFVAGAPRVLVARAARARDVLPDTLRAAGCEVDVVAAYETRPPPPEPIARLARDLADGRIDIVTFTSSSTVENLCDLLGPRAVELLARPRIASIGPITTATASGRGLRVDLTAREYTVPGLVEALLETHG